MITKILFTIVVIVAVLLFFRYQNQRLAAKVSRPPPQPTSKLGRWVAYGFVVVLILISAGFYSWHWKEQRRVLTIRVIGDGETVNYQAYRKDYKQDANRFQTLDGKTVIRGDSDRVEILDGH